MLTTTFSGTLIQDLRQIRYLNMLHLSQIQGWNILNVDLREFSITESMQNKQTTPWNKDMLSGFVSSSC